VASQLLPPRIARWPGRSDGFLRDRATGSTTRVTESSNGAQGNGDSAATDISPDGGFIALYSQSTNLVPHDTNGVEEAFVYNAAMATIRRVSLSSSGRQANANSGPCGISDQGRYVAFNSGATNLVRDDTNNAIDMFRTGPLAA
jgi:Tol biopolymer transport system component